MYRRDKERQFWKSVLINYIIAEISEIFRQNLKWPVREIIIHYAIETEYMIRKSKTLSLKTGLKHNVLTSLKSD